ncbi:MAG: hypothetical protein MMC33_000031 [Icmadophila ericetorum]|nr:hypothetical protein [Icmadophila ericetorum]
MVRAGEKRSGTYTPIVDIFSLGIVFLQLMFPENHRRSLMCHGSGGFNHRQWLAILHETLSINMHCKNRLPLLGTAKHMLSTDPSLRFSATGLIETPEMIPSPIAKLSNFFSKHGSGGGYADNLGDKVRDDQTPKSADANKAKAGSKCRNGREGSEVEAALDVRINELKGEAETDPELPSTAPKHDGLPSTALFVEITIVE